MNRKLKSLFLCFKNRCLCKRERRYVLGIIASQNLPSWCRDIASQQKKEKIQQEFSTQLQYLKKVYPRLSINLISPQNELLKCLVDAINGLNISYRTDGESLLTRSDELWAIRDISNESEGCGIKEILEQSKSSKSLKGQVYDFKWENESLIRAPYAYDFVAFISYSSADRKWAERLKLKLEKFELPKSVARTFDSESRLSPKRTYPVFRDVDDLLAGSLESQLNYFLKRSKTLVVLCSPSARTSDWVKKEIGSFKNKSFEKAEVCDERIVPVIISGSAGSGNKSECLPELLEGKATANKDSDRLDGGWFHRIGLRIKSIEEIVVCKIVAVCYGCDANILIRKTMVVIYAKWCVAFFSIALLLAYAIDRNITHKEYYTDYVDVWGIPKGIYKLTESEMKKRDVHYRFEYRGRKGVLPWTDRVLRKMSYLNSSGVPVISDKGPLIKSFRYVEGSFDVESVEYLNLSGRPDYVDKNASESLKFFSAVDLRRPDKGTLIASPLYANSLVKDCNGHDITRRDGFQSRGKITRLLYIRDENGWTKKIKYSEIGYSQNVRSEEGVFGELLYRNEFGQVTNVFYLGSPGSDNFVMDKDKSIGYAIEYDSKTGLCTMFSYLKNQRGDLIRCKDGYASIKNEYDEAGNFKGCSYLDEAGMPVVNSALGYASLLVEYDAVKNSCLYSYRDAKGNPCAHKFGFFKERHILNEIGNVKECHFLDKTNEAMVNPRIGASILKYTYDKRGYLNALEFFDAYGKPCYDKHGVSIVKQDFDENGRWVLQEYFDVNTNRCNSNHGFSYATISYLTNNYDSAGSLIVHQYFDVNHRLCNDKNGIAKIEMKYDKKQNLTNIGYYNSTTSLCCCADNYAKVVYAYDDYGHLCREEYFDENANFRHCINDNQISRGEYEYDEMGNLKRAVFEKNGLRGGRFGKVYQHSNGVGVYEEYRWEYDSKRNVLIESSHARDGSLCASDAWGYAMIKRGYDENGNATNVLYLDENKDLCLYKGIYSRMKAAYDEYGHKTNVSFFGIAGNPIINSRGVHAYAYVYGRDGLKSEMNYGTNGVLCLNSHGFAIAKYEYDAKGNVSSQSYYDTKTNLVYNSMAGYAVAKWKYNAQNKLLSESFFDENKLLVIPPGRGCAQTENEYDDCGNLICETFKGVDGESVLYDGLGYARHVFEYKNGRVCSEAYYGCSGERVKPMGKKYSYYKTQLDEKNPNIVWIFEYDEKEKLIDKREIDALTFFGEGEN